MTSRFRRNLICAALLMAIVVLLPACQIAEPPVLRITATPEVLSTPPQDGNARRPPEAAADVNPLTGLKVPDPAVLRRPPLAAKISNAPALVRPQAGIAEADLVFEHYVEGRLTRLTAIYWTHTPPRIGSIRSARLIDLEIPAMYDTLLVYSGASEPIRQRIAELPFAARAYEGVSVGAPLYYRDPAIDPPHNLFAIPAAVWERARSQGLDGNPDDLQGVRFRASPPEDAPPAKRIAVDYGVDVVAWVYDEDSGVYGRTVNGEPHRDANTGEQVTAANVVIIYAHHQEDLSIVESEWQGNLDFSIEIQIWTLGPAALLRDGIVQRGYWHRWEEDHMLSFWGDEEATEPLYLKPGNTWFQVVPLDFAGVTVE